MQMVQPGGQSTCPELNSSQSTFYLIFCIEQWYLVVF